MDFVADLAIDSLRLLEKVFNSLSSANSQFDQ